MDKSEKIAFILSGMLLVLFFGGIMYAAIVEDIDVPTCITNMEPFESDTLF